MLTESSVSNRNPPASKSFPFLRKNDSTESPFMRNHAAAPLTETPLPSMSLIVSSALPATGCTAKSATSSEWSILAPVYRSATPIRVMSGRERLLSWGKITVANLACLSSIS